MPSRIPASANVKDASAPFSFDIADFSTWPPCFRERDICRDASRGYAGILPISRAAWRSLITDGFVSEGLLIGNKTRVWRREEIIDLCVNGVKRRPRGRRALAREAQRRAAVEPELPVDP